MRRLFLEPYGLQTFSVGLSPTLGVRNSLLLCVMEVPRSLEIAFCSETVHERPADSLVVSGYSTAGLHPGTFQNRLSLKAYLRTVSCLLLLSRALPGPCRASLEQSCTPVCKQPRAKSHHFCASILLMESFCPNDLLECISARCP